MIHVQTLDTQIHEILLQQILAGTLAPGENLNEVRLAEELGTSRTPLRQALVRLHHEGFLVAEPNRGFFVAPLTASEARELYPVLSALEVLALRTGPPDATVQAELRSLNDRLAGTDPAATSEAVALNLRWHEVLLSGCGNGKLQDMLAVLRQQIYRYEAAFYTPGRERLETSVRLHEGILAALAEGDLDLACARLEAHWAEDLDDLVPLDRD